MLGSQSLRRTGRRGLWEFFAFAIYSQGFAQKFSLKIASTVALPSLGRPGTQKALPSGKPGVLKRPEEDWTSHPKYRTGHCMRAPHLSCNQEGPAKPPVHFTTAPYILLWARTFY